jgi:beta-lactamase regulating signal transducer with metallopeptidase domain
MLFTLTQSIAHFTLQSLLNSFWLGIVLIPLAAFFLRVMPRTNAATRYLVLISTLIVCMGSALITSTNMSKKSSAAAIPVRLISREPVSRSKSTEESGDRQIVDLEHNGMDEGLVYDRPVLRVQGPWSVMVPLLWGFISSVMFIRILLAYCYVNRLRRNASPLNAELDASFGRLARQSSTIRATNILGSSEVSMPMVVGPFRPAILIPISLLERLSPTEFEQIILHELAHIRRRDDWTKLIQRLFEALLFFHPMVIWVGRRINLEREVACDDWVVRSTGLSGAYAACLLKLMKMTPCSKRPLLSTTLAMAECHTYTRIKRVLDKNRGVSPSLAKLRVGASILVLTGGTFLCAKLSPILAVTAQTKNPIKQSSVEPDKQPPENQRPEPASPKARMAKVLRKQSTKRNQEAALHQIAPENTVDAGEQQYPSNDEQRYRRNEVWAAASSRTYSRTGRSVRSAVAFRVAKVTRSARASVGPIRISNH